MIKTYCDRCGNQIANQINPNQLMNQLVTCRLPKYDITIRENSSYYKVDLCDECAKRLSDVVNEFMNNSQDNEGNN